MWTPQVNLNSSPPQSPRQFGAGFVFSGFGFPTNNQQPATCKLSSMEPLVIAGRAFQSRLIVGTGKYKDGPQTQAAIEASGAEMVTVAVRRVNLDRSRESLLDFLDPQRYFLLPNTAGCFTAEEAIRAARLGREVGLSDWVKIEVIGDKATLYPDIQATLEATRVLVKEGFTVLPYTSDDIVYAKRLIDAGAAAVMPLGAPIGSGLGLRNLATLRILRELITEVPLIVDAGVGTASDATVAMETGLRWGADEYGYRGSCGPDSDGGSDAAWSSGGAAGFSGGTHADAALCYGEFAAGRHIAVTKPPPIVWRIAAAVLWVVSVVCLYQAIERGVTAEEGHYNPNLTVSDQIAIQHMSEIADRWSAAGWLLQFATAAVLSFGLRSSRVVRRIFVSLGVLIAVDGVTLLLMAVIVR